jgi:2',3'-cyclic-nucleotide 2'-phosphodiesterase (5'-nucleotidase family)
MCSAAIFQCAATSAAVIQVLHTNDQHSQFEASATNGFGGYAAVKGVMNSLKTEASATGIGTVTLDAGDFSEGSHLFFADKGVASWKMMNSMGYDAVTIGNHDWMVGVNRLNGILKNLPLNFSLLAANMKCGAYFKHFNNAVSPYKIINVNGVRVGVIGVVTASLAYSWRAQGCAVVAAKGAIKYYLKRVKKQSDVVILLSHLGLARDKKIAASVDGIDLVVSAHSHDVTHEPLMVTNRKGNFVPVLQAGAHTRYVGQAFMDVVPGQKPRFISSKLISAADFATSDSSMETAVAAIRKDFETQYGPDWLHEPIGFSKFPLEVSDAKSGISEWSKLVVDSFKRAAQTDVAIDSVSFGGNVIFPAGEVTREKIMALYPRTFDAAKDYMGWRVWKGETTGIVLDSVVKATFRKPNGLVFSGVTVDAERGVFINGKPLVKTKIYTVAVPEGMARGSVDISYFARFIIGGIKTTGVPVWKAIENQIQSL